MVAKCIVIGIDTAHMEIIPCNPGFGASCALCCGSHNYKAPFKTIKTLCHDRTKLFEIYSREYMCGHIRASRSNLTGSYYFYKETDFLPTLPDPIVIGGVQCPFVGYKGTWRIGCLLYGDIDDSYRRDCYYQYGGKHFTCNAFHELSKDDIIYAARLLGDWYYYPILIHTPESLEFIKKNNPDPKAIPEDKLRKIKDSLLKDFSKRNNLHLIHRYFS